MMHFFTETGSKNVLLKKNYLWNCVTYNLPIELRITTITKFGFNEFIPWGPKFDIFNKINNL